MLALNHPFWRLAERFYSYPDPEPLIRTKPMQGWDMLFEEPRRMQGWVRLARKKRYGGNVGDCKITAAEFDELMGHAVAVSDAAASCFAAELIEAYPDAKVVLNVRDVDAWHASAVKNLCTEVNDKWFGTLLCWFESRLWWMFHVHQRVMWPQLFRCTDSTLRSGVAANGKLIYREHCAMIKGLVPKDRLLEWNVADG